MGELELGVLLAFGGGVLSFLSPCVLPLAPPYLAFLSGRTLDEMTDASRDERLLTRLALAALLLVVFGFWRLIVGEGRLDLMGGGALVGAVGLLAFALSRDDVTRRVFTTALFFVFGLGTVFVALGLTATSIGQILAQNKYAFGVVAGLVIYALGQHFIGLRRAAATLALMLALWAGAVLLQGGGLAEAASDAWFALALFAALGAGLQAYGMVTGHDHIPFLYREARFQTGGEAGGLAGAYVVGLAFAFGWTPCIGPILGLVLTLAAQRDSVGDGAIMLGVYAAGLGFPFLLAAMFVRPFLRFMRAFRRHMGTVETAMGGLLVVVGLMMGLGTFETLAFWLLETFPGLATIG